MPEIYRTYDFSDVKGIKGMDRIDWKIIEVLEEEGRISYAELGDRVGLSKSPCWARVRDIEQNGTIDGFGAKINPQSLGLNVQCYISVTIDFETHTEFETAVLNHPAIVECHTTAGESDYLLRVFSQSVEHLDGLLRHDIAKLPGVQSSKSTVCLKTIKHRTSLSKWAAHISNDV